MHVLPLGRHPQAGRLLQGHHQVPTREQLRGRRAEGAARDRGQVFSNAPPGGGDGLECVAGHRFSPWGFGVMSPVPPWAACHGLLRPDHTSPTQGIRWSEAKQHGHVGLKAVGCLLPSPDLALLPLSSCYFRATPPTSCVCQTRAVIPDTRQSSPTHPYPVISKTCCVGEIPTENTTCIRVHFYPRSSSPAAWKTIRVSAPPSISQVFPSR